MIELVPHRKRLTAGWIIIFLCGVFGSLNGLISYGSSVLSILNPHRPWMTGAGVTRVTLSELSGLSPEIGPYWVLVNLVAWVNLTFTGFTLALAALRGVRERQRWGWYIAFLVWMWVGFNDTVGVIAVYRMTGVFIPTAPIPTTLGAIGLFLSYPAVFHKSI